MVGGIDFSQFGENAGFVRSVFELYQVDRSLVDESWAAYFDLLATNLSPEWSSHSGKSNGQVPSPDRELDDSSLAARAVVLVGNFLQHGHRIAKISPISMGLKTEGAVPELEFSFSKEELLKRVPAVGFRGKSSYALGVLIAELQQVYCGSIGFEFEHLTSVEERAWLRSRIEERPFGAGFGAEEQKRILRALVEAEELEAGLNRKYVGQTRFSAEGGEALMPMLDFVRERGPELGINEVVFGMAHRARLNVLANVLNKPLSEILSECEDKNVTTVVGSGDVKYHMGYSLEYLTGSSKNIILSMCPNPSHLEFVNPVVEGVSRAKQDLVHDKQRDRVLPILIHGDAAIIGQGVVAETFNMSHVPGYTTGGTLHIVFNNQIGFTTDWNESRSVRYCSDMAKSEVPVFHVNADDPDACVWVAGLALEYRQRFGNDVIVDLVCYRKYGHNEGDDPSFTQPQMYKEIKHKPSVVSLYAEKLMSGGIIDADAVKVLQESYRTRFDETHAALKEATLADACAIHGKIRGIAPNTSVSMEKLHRVAEALTEVPSDFQIYPKLKQIIAKRVKTLSDGPSIDWGFAENLAFGSLVLDGYNVRLSGQDSGRGTFGQRNLELTDYETGNRIFPLDALKSEDHGGSFEVYNSVLSETGVMGFEFGYATQAQRGLVIWEAQYGDFCNGGQVIIDQFLANSEQAWGQTSGVVFLLPHGYEGQGPEHSTGRLERFLQLAGEGNMSVCYPSTAAQYFHLLRRQALSPIKRPLIVMTPKSLLRSQSCASHITEFTDGSFRRVISENFGAGQKSKNLLLMSGKIYHDLVSEFKKDPAKCVEVIRIEELYPFPSNEVLRLVKESSAKRVLWVQEEPENMGAWNHVYMELHKEIPNLEYLGRARSASVATGSHKHHVKEQANLLQRVLASL